MQLGHDLEDLPPFLTILLGNRRFVYIEMILTGELKPIISLLAWQKVKDKSAHWPVNKVTKRDMAWNYLG